MKIFKLKTDYECLVKIDNEEVLLSPHETLQCGENCLVLVYPTHSIKNTLPFSFNTNSLKDCKFYNYIELDNNTSLVCFHKESLCESYDISNINVGGANCIFEVGENKLIVSYKSWKKIITLEEKYDTYITKHKNDIAYIKLSNKRSQILYAFNVKTAKVRAFIGENINLQKDGFDIQNKSNKSQYKITSEGLKLDSSEKEDINDFSNTNETLAYKFLNAIKNNNVEEAHSLCSENLQNKINKDTLKSYFGNIANFYYLSPYKYAVQSDGKLKMFSFEIENKKIIDIDN